MKNNHYYNDGKQVFMQDRRVFIFPRNLPRVSLWKRALAKLKDALTFGGKLNGAFARHGAQTYSQRLNKNKSK